MASTSIARSITPNATPCMRRETMSSAKPAITRARRLRWKRVAMDCKSSERGRSSIRSNSPPRTNCGKKSSPRANSSARPKANSAMPYMRRMRLAVHSPIAPKRSNMSSASSGSVAHEQRGGEQRHRPERILQLRKKMQPDIPEINRTPFITPVYHELFKAPADPRASCQHKYSRPKCLQQHDFARARERLRAHLQPHR